MEDFFEWYRVNFRNYAARRGAAESFESVGMRLRIETERSFLIECPGSDHRSDELRILSTSHELLFELVKDDELGRRLREDFWGSVRSSQPSGVPGPEPDAWAYRLANRRGETGGYFWFLHLDSNQDHTYMFTFWDCLLLCDLEHRVVFYNPIRRAMTKGGWSSDDLFRPDGEVLQHRIENAGTPRGFRFEGPDRRPLAVWRAVHGEHTPRPHPLAMVDMIGSIPPLAPVLHTIFTIIHRGQVKDFADRRKVRT